MTMSKQRRGPVQPSDSPREVCLSCSARATLAFNLNRGLNSFTRSAAARSEAEETNPKRRKSLLTDFNGTDAAVLGATAAAVAAIAVSGERAPPNDSERAAAFLADFERNTEKMRATHESNPGAGEGNSRLTIEITYPAHLNRTDISIPFSPRGRFTRCEIDGVDN